MNLRYYVNLLYELCAYRARTDLIIVWDLVRWLALCARNNIIIRLVSRFRRHIDGGPSIVRGRSMRLPAYIYLLKRQGKFND